MAYWTSEDEDPPVYHDNPDCPSGQQILPENKETGSAPVGHRHCEQC